jgi:hypothetical protein
MCDFVFVDGFSKTFPCTHLPSFVKPDGAYLLLAALATLPSLATLNLQANGLTDETAYALLDLIWNAKVLKVLDMRDNRLNKTKREKIEEARQRTSPAPGRLLIIKVMSGHQAAPNKGSAGRRPSVIAGGLR